MDDKQEHKPALEPQGIGSLFMFFNEVGIINQLASSLFQKRLADGLTVAQFSVLNHLTRVTDGQTPMALASAFQVPKTSMTHTLSGLEKRGLVESRPNEGDGRSKHIFITTAGKQFREQAIAAMSNDLGRLAERLDTHAMLDAIPMLAKVRSVLDEDRN